MSIMHVFSPNKIGVSFDKSPSPNIHSNNRALLNGRQVFANFQAEYLPKLENVISKKLPELIEIHGKTRFDIEIRIMPVLRSEIEEIQKSIPRWLTQQPVDPAYRLDCNIDVLWSHLSQELHRSKNPLQLSLLSLIRESAANDLDFIDYVSNTYSNR